MDNHNQIFAGIALLVGTMLPLIGKFILDMFSTKKSTESVEIARQFTELREQRNEVSVRTQALVDELQKQIFALRSAMVELQEHNLTVSQENAALKVQVANLTAENIELKSRILELESEVKTMLSGG